MSVHIPHLVSHCPMCFININWLTSSGAALICLPRAAAGICKCMPSPASLPFEGPLLNVR